MGLLLGPEITGIFIADLERNVIPKLSTHMTKWKRYVDDTITYIKLSSIDYFLSYSTLSIEMSNLLLKKKKIKTFLF